MLELDLVFDPLRPGKPIAVAVFDARNRDLGRLNVDDLKKAIQDFEQADYNYGASLRGLINLDAAQAKLG